MVSITVPVQGTNIKHEGVPATQAGSQPPAVAAPPPLRQDNPAAAAPAPAPNVHNIDPFAGLEPVFDQFGHVKFVPSGAAQDLTPGQLQGDSTGSAEPPDAIANSEGSDDETQAPPSFSGQGAAAPNEISELRNHVSQLTQVVQLLAAGHINGAGQQQQAKQAIAPPDPASFDFNDPTEFANFHRQNAEYTRALIAETVAGALAPHKEAIEGARWQSQYNQVFASRGNDPNFQSTMKAALKLVSKNPARFTIPEAYEVVSDLISTQGQGRPNASTQKLTPQQAKQKTDQARRLPASNGVATSNRAQLPANVRGLGAIMAWNRQHGTAQ